MDQQKRRMDRSGELANRAHRSEKQFSPSSSRRYTIAWVCALPNEMVAALAMLDDVHEPLPQPANDINSYTFGSIRRHNVVIACLPTGQYGMNNAVTVLTHLIRTFTSVRLCLMVGIGGGSPREGSDVRLGDVVIGTKVVQHDLGKMVGSGQIIRTADPRTLNPLIGTAISFLQAKHELDSSQIPLILEERFKGRPRYNRPTTEDRLFISTYPHNSQALNCNDCSPSELVKRRERSTNIPFVHYGTIASGNQVIKDSIQRDVIGKQLNAICFEMEAAGLMDICPCLSIRGICDYSDSHKNDEWQEYAAATAAACARELLEQLPHTEDALASTTGQQDPGFQDEKHKKCIQDLRATDPRDDKTRIQDTKGGLLADAYRWIFDNKEFREWYDAPESQLLWIKGDPGKGKTMLLCGIIDRLEKERSGSLSYFFCQATEARLSNATAVLRGLIYLLVIQQPSLIVHVEEKYDHAGKKLFEDENAWQALSKIFTAMLGDSRLDDALLIVDALDECTINRDQLLDLIIRSTKVKWIVTSRNWLEIKQKLDHAQQKVGLQLELNQESVSTAVEAYIEYKVNQLADGKRYDEELKNQIQRHLIDNADGTFLWVALVCQELADSKVVRKRHALSKLKSFPQGLDPLYERMMDHVSRSNDASVCEEILALYSVVYRPINLDELKVLVESLDEDDYGDLPEIIGSCGSFLTIRENIVYFVHQSAKDFLLNKARRKILPSGTAGLHKAIFIRSLKALSETLKRDICRLRDPGYSIDDISLLNLKPLSPIGYSCVYWMDHLGDTDHAVLNNKLVDGGDVHIFIQTNFLNWLECLSLLRRLGEGVKAISRLADLARTIETAEQLANLLRDAHRFVLTFIRGIEIAPLQVYASALVFSPECCLIRDLFKSEEPDWIILKPKMDENWNNCLQALKGHREEVNSLAFSENDKLLASGSPDETVRIWDTDTGRCQYVLEGHHGFVHSVAFFPDTKRLASTSDENQVKIWDTETGACLYTLDFQNERKLVLSQNGVHLAVVSYDWAVSIWDLRTCACFQRFEHCGYGSSICFSPDGKRLISGSPDRMIKVWDIETGICLQELEQHSFNDALVVLSSDYKCLASSSARGAVSIRDTATGISLLSIQMQTRPSMAFSGDGKHIALGGLEVSILNIETGQILHVIKESGHRIFSVAFASNGQQLAIGSADTTVRIWDISMDVQPRTVEDHGDTVTSITISPDGQHLASGSKDNTVKIWSIATGICQHTLLGHNETIYSLAFSTDSKCIASSSTVTTVRIWDTMTGICLQTLNHNHPVRSVIFSSDSQYLASASGTTVQIWDMKMGECVSELDQGNTTCSVGFSADKRLLVTGLFDGTIWVWGTKEGKCLRRIQRPESVVISVAVSLDKQYLASSSNDQNIKIWDLETGQCLQEVDVGIYLRHLSFDPRTNSTLYTDIGRLNLEFPDVGTQPIVKARSPCFDQSGYNIGRDNTWIMKNGRNLLWIPPEYYPLRSAVFGSTVSLGCKSGRVIIMTFC
ncbi:vegetatible incompatibility het-e-1 [Fusarium beomiforme]|uniref:Vegetatible incompatibility het-e-1 n=1 Tax=Fusarium beomiforme TaxID=44412 RepID=A0A9P5AQG8_9HYPO|nr:vegetatible incompatibility het-e-1 [Fusarium beomiforme]